MIRLMGHLAQFASFSKQGELLCTQSLAYLLKDTDAKNIFSSFLGSAIGLSIPQTLLWRTEHRQGDGSRPDIEGCQKNGIAVIKIEAKLEAKFGKGQLKSYIDELLQLETPCSLIALVPQNRHKEAVDYISFQFSFEGEGPWQVQNVSVAVITWEDTFQRLGAVNSRGFSEDLEQLCSLYRVLNGDDMEPLTTDEEVLLWREKEIWWEKLVDLTTRRLTSSSERLLPMSTEKAEAPYSRRYICRNINGVESCYSIGTRDPFQNHQTPIWLRFHRGTGYFTEISQQFIQSSLDLGAVRSGKHIWYPLEVPQNADRDAMINSLVVQVKKIISTAYGSVGPNFSTELRNFISQEKWTFAKTMPKWPHEYLVREKVDEELFVKLVKHIRTNGYQGLFYKKPITYYEEDGFVYWTMGAPVSETTIINRCIKENTYESRLANGTLPD